MQRSTLFFVLLALFASVTIAAKFDVNVEIKKDKVEDSLPESELAEEEVAEEPTQNEKPSPAHKKPVIPNGKEQNKSKPGNKNEKPEEEAAASQHGAAENTANKIVNKIEKIISNPPMKGEKPQEPIKMQPDSVDPLFSLPTPALGTGKKPHS